MSLEDKFNKEIEEWIKYCNNSNAKIHSSGEYVRDCDHYREIVSMGYEALPLIRQVYDIG